MEETPIIPRHDNMKILITESQYKLLLESKDDVVEQLLEMENFEIDFDLSGVSEILENADLEDYFGIDVIDDNEIEDTLSGGDKIYMRLVFVSFYINNLIQSQKPIYFLTKNNKVIGVDHHGGFSSVATSFGYVPYDVLTTYFIDRAKTYLEQLLN